MPALTNYYDFLYGEKIAVDRRMMLSCLMSPLVMRMANEDYCLIMRCLFHNVSFDDGCDQYLIHDFWINFLNNCEKL